MEYTLLAQLLPETENPAYVQEKIDAFIASDTGIDENTFNEILAEIELSGFRKGLKTGLELLREINCD